ncbi:PorT family protein [Barnesiella propionica]|uniref:outer membrane beta-barrel protein n=1 Tax=Barnesiella propionica TaxID=2981781 RepID=UPI0011C90241|nr:outer membrane beta-barrel protein [Barnesiella propionica]MCU6767518.1 PorT family protein [Barnesiella propionica]
MKKKFVIINIIFLFSLTAFSQSDTTAFRKWETHISVGYTIGGTTPIPLPSEIRKIDSYRPGANLLLAVDFTRWFNSEWGITTGIGIGTQGMSISADVKYWNTDLVVGDGESTGRFTGTFSGKNKTKVKNGFLRIPIQASWRPLKRWTFHGGTYISLLIDPKFEGTASDGYIRNGGPTGDRIQVEQATFDFSDELRLLDSGLLVGADWQYNKRFFITGQLAWGFVPVFPNHFSGIPYKMYNIYATVGISYKL